MDPYDKQMPAFVDQNDYAWRKVRTERIRKGIANHAIQKERAGRKATG